MLKLLGILLPFVCVYAQPHLYLLPDENERFLHFITHTIQSSSDTILISSPSLKHNRIKKALIKASRNGSRIRIITRDIHGDPLYLAQYEGIDLYRFTARPIEGSILLVDERWTCFVPSTLDEADMENTAALIHCSEHSSDIRATRIAVQKILGRSKLYLK